MTTKIKFTGWDVIDRLKAVLKGEEKIEIKSWDEEEGRAHSVEWTQGEYYEEVGYRSVVCFVGGLSLVEKLFLHPGQTLEPFEDHVGVTGGKINSKQTLAAMRACADVIVEQFRDRVASREEITQGFDFNHPTLGGEWVQEAVITFNDHEDTTVEDVYTVLDKAAVTLAEKEGI